MSMNSKSTRVPGLTQAYTDVKDVVIVSDRNPTIHDSAQIGSTWTNKLTAKTFILQQISQGQFIWNLISTSGSLITLIESAFSAFLSADIPNVTGDGTLIPIVCDSVINNTGDYNSLTGVFTAPVSGLYLFSWTCSTFNSSGVPLNIWNSTAELITPSGNYVSNSFDFGFNPIALLPEVSSEISSKVVYLSAGDAVSLGISAFFPSFGQIIGIKGFSAPNFGVVFAGKFLN